MPDFLSVSSISSNIIGSSETYGQDMYLYMFGKDGDTTSRVDHITDTNSNIPVKLKLNYSFENNSAESFRIAGITCSANNFIDFLASSSFILPNWN